MSSFIPRTRQTVPTAMGNNPYWYDVSINPGAKDPIWLPNCTTYCYGRAAEIAAYTGNTVDYNTIFGGGFDNAKDWYSESLWPTTAGSQITSSRKLLLGDILCWGGGGSVSGTVGHVATVEEIIDSDHVKISQSHFNLSGAAQTRTYPGTRSKRYFEYGTYTISTGVFNLEYHYNANGTYQDPSYSVLNLTNLLGAIHNPFAPQDKRIIPILIGYNLRKKKGGRSIVRL